MEDYLQHYGVLGMKWGVRRYQNKDGALTSTRKSRQEKQLKRAESKARNKLEIASNLYFQQRRALKAGNKRHARIFQRDAEKNIAKANMILKKVGSSNTDGILEMAKSGKDWWEKYGYETIGSYGLPRIR